MLGTIFLLSISWGDWGSKRFDNLAEILGLIRDGIGIKKPILFPYACIMYSLSMY